jgi:hypothetical protein
MRKIQFAKKNFLQVSIYLDLGVALQAKAACLGEKFKPFTTKQLIITKLKHTASFNMLDILKIMLH